MARVSKDDNAVAVRFHALDLLATLVAVVGADGRLRYVNAALEDALGLSRRSIGNTQLADFFTDPSLLLNALAGAKDNEFAALRYDTWLRCLHRDPCLCTWWLPRPMCPTRWWWSCCHWSNKPVKTAKSG